MSIAEAAGRAPRASRFAAIKTALARQKHDLSRARRRWSALLPTYRKRDLTTAGAVTLGAEPLRVLQAILDSADVIAVDKPGYVQQVHLLVTLPDWLLDRATAIAAFDEDDEDTDGGEDQQDLEHDDDDEFSLGFPDAIVDQSRKFPAMIRVGDAWQSAGNDLELDRADLEPSLGSSDPSPSAGSPGYVAFADQTHWAEGDRLDREVEEDGEDDQDLEPGLRDAPKSLDDPRMGYPLRRAMEPVEREAAKERQRDHGGTAPGKQ